MNENLKNILEKVTIEFLNMSDEEHRQIRKNPKYDNLYFSVDHYDFIDEEIEELLK